VFFGLDLTVEIGALPFLLGQEVVAPCFEIRERSYRKGIKVSKAAMVSLDITGDQFHPEWAIRSG
jgi:hypothetical protein